MALLSLALILLQTQAPPTPQTPQASLRAKIEARVAQTAGSRVGVYYRDLTTGDSLTVSPVARFHAASTMKLPIMIQVFRDRDHGLVNFDDSVTITNTFKSIVDSSPYQLDVTDDSDSSLYKRLGQKATIRELIELMETVSSNLATNLLITRVDAKRANATAHALGADSIVVLRGVEDGKAFQAGLNNTTTARDLGVLLAAIATDKAASPQSCRDMLAILGRQQFKEGIPAGLPPGTTVYHKTGWITRIYHDAAIVEPTARQRYVLVVLTGGIEKEADAHALVRDISKLVFDARRNR